MNYLQNLGLAAVASGAMMAFAGAGPASADELCTEPANVQTMCSPGKMITNLNLSLVGSSKWEDTGHSIVLDTCTSGEWKITELDELHNNKTGTESITGTSPIADISWGSGGTGCTFVMSL